MDRNTAPMQIKEFAGRTGVTVRALHHYDRLGLLRPSVRTAAGYRLYGENELIRLQQIATLKFLGCPLKQIKAVLAGPAAGLGKTLGMQREALERQRLTLNKALRAIDRAQRLFDETGRADWDALKHLIEVVQMEQDKSWMMSYFSSEQREALAARGPGLQKVGEEGWAKLIPEIEVAAAEGMDPASEEAKALVVRQEELIGLFTGGDAGIRAGLERMYADKSNWPSTFKSPFTEKAQIFLRAAKKAHGLVAV